MKPGTEWTPGTRGKVIGMRLAGAKISTIITRLNVPRTTAQDWIKNDRTHVKKRSGRPKALSERDLKKLKRYIKSNRETRRLSIQQIITDMGFDVSEPTLIKALAELNLFHCIA